MAATHFTGFGPGLYEFFEGLAVHNERDWFHAHKQQYVTEVREPLEALFEDLAPTFGEARLFRINRDTRFSADKSPYKTQQAGIVHQDGGRGSLFFQVDAAGCRVGFGVAHLDTGQLTRFRGAVDGRAGEELAAIVARLRRSFTVGTLAVDGVSEDGDLKRVPKPYPADHPRGDLLRLKRLVAIQDHPRPAWLGGPEAVRQVATIWKAGRPLLDWLGQHVGPADEVEGRPRPR